MFLWWASSGYPLDGPICPSTGTKDDCTRHNVILYSAWGIAKVADQWGVLITAIATGFIAWFTFTLRNSTERLWLASERHSERELRAFVFAKAIAITPNTLTHAYTGAQGTYEVPVSWTVSVMWENGGGTRTKNMFSHASSEFFDEEMPDNFPFPDLGDQTRIRTMIGPRAFIFSGGFEFRVADPHVLDVHKGAKHLYIWGWAEYDDIFDNTPRHRTEFCYELFFTGAAFPTKIQVSFRMHRLHNAADNDCQYPLKTQRL